MSAKRVAWLVYGGGNILETTLVAARRPSTTASQLAFATLPDSGGGKDLAGVVAEGGGLLWAVRTINDEGTITRTILRRQPQSGPQANVVTLTGSARVLAAGQERIVIATAPATRGCSTTMAPSSGPRRGRDPPCGHRRRRRLPAAAREPRPPLAQRDRLALHPAGRHRRRPLERSRSGTGGRLHDRDGSAGGAPEQRPRRARRHRAGARRRQRTAGSWAPRSTRAASSTGSTTAAAGTRLPRAGAPRPVPF